MATPWYMSNMDSPGGGYGEMLDPVCQNGSCSYLKPDTNLDVPNGTPITALQSGTVTSVTDHGAGGGGLSVVVASDSPINSLATHVAYNYLGSSNVSVGQHLTVGQQLGSAGSPYGINFALGLTSDNVWGNGTFSQNATGNPQLDPRQLLNAVRGGTPIPTSGISGVSSIPIVGGAISALEATITNAIEEVGVFIIALVIILLGVYILAQKQIDSIAKKGIKAGEVAAVA